MKSIVNMDAAAKTAEDRKQGIGKYQPNGLVNVLLQSQKNLGRINSNKG